MSFIDVIIEMFTSGDQIKLVATNSKTDETRRFVVKANSTATSSGLKLYGYDPAQNKLNLLEDFGVDGGKTKMNAQEEARRRLDFYCPKNEGWKITEHYKPQVA